MSSGSRFRTWLWVVGVLAAGWWPGQLARAQLSAVPDTDKAFLHALKGTVWEVCQTKQADTTNQTFGCGWLVHKKQKLLVVPYGVVGDGDKVVVVFPAFEKDQLVNDA